MSDDFDEAFYLAANPDVAAAVHIRAFRSGIEHFVWRGRAEGRAGKPPEGESVQAPSLAHRKAAALHLAGQGLEIGALTAPCPVREGCQVTYADRFDSREAAELFREAAVDEAVEPTLRLDLDADGLALLEAASQDFVVANNVLQLVANPIAALESIFRILRPGGHLVLAIPDKRFSPDRVRAVTSWDHLMNEYLHRVRAVSDAHYIDVITLLFGGEAVLGVDALDHRLQALHRHCYPVHVWETEGARELLQRSATLCDVALEPLLEMTGPETRCEYFLVARKRA